MKVAGIILAGGLSRRMGGREKSLMELGGQPLIQHVKTRFEKQVETLAINANGDPDRFEFLGLDVVADPVDGFVGPLAGVLAGMQWATRQKENSHVVSVAADTPFFPNDLVGSLMEKLAETPSTKIALASSQNRLHPVFGLWPVSLASALQDFLERGETRKVLAFVDEHGLAETPFEIVDDFDPFFNINTDEDLQLAANRVGQSL